MLFPFKNYEYVNFKLITINNSSYTVNIYKLQYAMKLSTVFMFKMCRVQTEA